MANRLGMNKSISIKNLRAAGMSERKIAAALGVSRNAVRRHLASAVSNDTKAPTAQTASQPAPGLVSNDTTSTDKAPTGQVGDLAASDAIASTVIDSANDSARVSHRPSSRSQCEPYRDVILAKLADGLTAQRIFQDLHREHNFEGTYWSVNRFVNKLGANSELPFRRLEVAPGTELQVDFGSGAKTVNAQGKLTKTYVFRGVLSHSRKGYSESVWRMTTENFIRALENCFARLGGVPQTIVFDNAKCAVKQADWYDPELHPKIVDFCQHYGCVLIPTRPRTPRHKGKVERGIDYVQENGLRGHTFESLSQQNAHLDQWESQVADTRIHGTIRQQVGALFESVERAALMPLPSTRFPFYHEAKRKVSRDGHLSINRAYYSAPPEYLGCDVWVRYNNTMVRILNHRMETIALHATKAPGSFSTLDQHIDPRKTSGIERGIEYLLRKVRFLGPHSARWCERLIEQRGVQASRSMQGLLSLSHKYSSDEIEQACDTAWRSDALNYRVIKRLLADRAAAAQQTMTFMDTHPIIRPVSEYGTFIQQVIQGRG